MSASSYIPLTSEVLAITDGTIFCPHDDSTWDLVGRRITVALIIAGAFGWAIYYPKYQAKYSPKIVNKNVQLHIIDLHKDERAVREVRETQSSIDDNSDTTLRSVESLCSIQSSDASTQHSDESPPSSSDPPPAFPNGPIGSVDEEPPKDGKITKSIQCGGGQCNI